MDFTAMPTHSFFEVDDISLKEIEAHVQRDYASEDLISMRFGRAAKGNTKGRRNANRTKTTTRKECMRCCSTARTKAWKSFGT